MVNEILQYGLAGLAALQFTLGLVDRSRRASFWLAAALAAGAAFSAHTDSFWPMVVLTLGSLWSAFIGLDVVDLSWRVRTGLVFSVGMLATFALWPSIATMSGGRVPCPSYINEHVTFRLVAGLDLRGGLRLVYTVDVDEAIKDRRDRLYDDMRRELARVFGLHDSSETPSEEVYTKLRELVELSKNGPTGIGMTIREGAEPSKVDPRFLEQFRGDLTFSRSDDQRELSFEIRETSGSAIRQRAVEQAREIILRRVDELGLREAAVSTRDEDIIVEVPGEDEQSFARIREIISQTARLEFKLLDDDVDFFGPMVGKQQSLPEGLEFRPEQAPVGLDESGEEVEYKTNYYAEFTIGEGENAQDALKRLKEWTATLELPPDRELGYHLIYETDEGTLKEREVAWRTYLLKSRADITGDMIRDAQAQAKSDDPLGGWLVAVNFTDQGGRIFEQVTGANVKRRFAIILDDRTESTPVIQSRIPGGRATITMGDRAPDQQLLDARKLELVLRSGALPAPISPTNEQHIGPSLGRDAIRLGVQGALFGGLLVVVFMVLYYRRAGLVADVAVAMNLFLQLAILASLGASMTLPGIAGLALTIGMSVDANVLINERIRDELRAGKSPRAAVDLGYSKALSAILDGQVTTLMAGVVMAQYGTGPIKGFAVTLIVGVICSVFTGVMVSRVMFDMWVRLLGRQGRLDVG